MTEKNEKHSTSYSLLDNRSLITISGEDRYEFLQGLISNDVNKCQQGSAIWSALLTAQGKYLYDFYVYEQDQSLVIECAKEDLMPLGQMLRKYQLRSNISLGIDSTSRVMIVWNVNRAEFGLSQNRGASLNSDNCMAFSDPRHSDLGMRIIGKEEDLEAVIDKHSFIKGDIELYHENRISLGVPEGAADIERNKGLLLEYGFGELEGVDWDKGCYMGQELTARTKYRALIKKRLFPVAPITGSWGETPASGAKITCNGKELGEIRSVGNKAALAFIRMDRWADALQSDDYPMVMDSHVKIIKPDWIQLDGTYDLAI